MFALELCNALKVLHHAEPMIVCRDLKAENVMIDNNGQVKIVDFDIARTVHEGQGRDTVLMGTAEYAAPEQYGYFQTDNRSDIFSLGILLNYTMTGKFPVEKTVNGKMRAVIRKCICMEPLERYQSVEELESEIRNIFMIGEDENEKNESSAKGVVRLTIPGFRTGKVWKMIVAVLGYTFIGCLTLTMEFESEGVKLYGAKLWVERIILFAAMIFFLFLAAGYRGWNREIPIVRSENIWIRTAGLVGAFVLLFIGVVFVFVVVETIV